MNLQRLVSVALAVGFCLSASSRASVCSPEGGPTRVLFIGNSYTHYHNLPEIVRGLAEQAGAGPVDVKMVAFGGGRLVDHWEGGEASQLLAGERWDVVVLQEQSTLGVNHVVDGKPRVAADHVFLPAAQKWAAEIVRRGARVVFYLTWARKATPEDQELLTAAYTKAARMTGALVAPVGTAWSEVRKEAVQIELFDADGSHPSPAGSYLAACTLMATIFDRNPLGLSGNVSGAPVDPETRQVERGRTIVLADVPTAHARVLQAAAWRAVQAMKGRR